MTNSTRFYGIIIMTIMIGRAYDSLKLVKEEWFSTNYLYYHITLELLYSL